MKAKEWAEKFDNSTDLYVTIEEYIDETIALMNKRKEVDGSLREQYQKWVAIFNKTKKVKLELSVLKTAIAWTTNETSVKAELTCDQIYALLGPP